MSSPRPQSPCPQSPRPQSPQIEMTDERSGIFWQMMAFFHILFRARARTENNPENRPDVIEENG